MSLRNRVATIESELECVHLRMKNGALQVEVNMLSGRVKDLKDNLEFQVSRHDELKEQFDMLMDHLGLRIENGPRIVKDK